MSACVAAQSKLNIHGYFSQAFAISQGHQIFGIPEQGTSDYRTMALQFRYDADDQNLIIMQISHERMGKSPIMVLEEGLKLDWAIYQHSFSNGLSFKVGKIQIPFGIFNEIRDVGTLLPFYRVPYASYGEGNYMSETINGISVSYSFFSESGWKIDFTSYLGEWKWIEWAARENPFTQKLTVLVETPQIRNVFGGQWWFNTPVDGLRLGLAGYHGDISGGLSFSEETGIGKENINVFHFSVDYEQTDFFIRSEHTRYFLKENDIFAFSLYGQAGYNIFKGMWLNVQAGTYKAINVPIPLLNIRSDIDYYEDFALGLNYFFSAQLALKLETHWNKSLIVEEKMINFGKDKPFGTNYMILSLSTSF